MSKRKSWRSETTYGQPDQEMVYRVDWMLILISAILTVLGLVMQYSASSYDSSLVERQGIFAVGGAAIMFIMSRVPTRVWYKLSIWLYLVALAVTAVTKLIGKDVKGARRWIEIAGVTFQPSELLKVGVIMAMAYIAVKNINQINRREELPLRDVINRKITFVRLLYSIRGYLALIVCVGIAATTVAYFTKDLGTAVIIFGIGFIMMLIISPDLKYLWVILAAAAVIGIIFILTQSYRVGRITAWLDLDNNTTNLGYQIKQGLYAIGSGGWFGKGLGKSTQKDVIPEPHTDMIFTVLCEELGIAGGLVVILLFVLLILRLGKIYSSIHDLYGKMIVAGTASHIAIQAFVNIAVMLNLIPNTGVPLPFISYGGSALICLYIELGLVQSVRYREVKTAVDPHLTSKKIQQQI